MLIVCNGIFKSGSTWLHAIVLEILKIKEVRVSKIDKKYTNNVKSPTPIIESKFEEFLRNEDYKNRTFVNKSHFFQVSTLNKNYNESVVFLFSERDLKDSIVSHYFHVKKKYNYISSFSIYYWTIGRLKAYEIVRFNQMYRNYFNDDNFIHYSTLINNFSSAVQKIANLIGFSSLSKEEINNLKENTSLSNMRNKILIGDSNYYSTVTKGREDLIRTGKEREYLTFFSLKKIQDINKIEKLNTSICFKFLYYFAFTLRRKILQIE
ncbi:MAG: hypothetical protein CMD02_07615 [Flavobacteriales bacterium]|nr:hypothetical protein [Flavobacteriales bacterium]|tara:strand:+ start:14668 stop:15462 length:795 start_codon:yes stop_codon:yes gene_type:complete